MTLVFPSIKDAPLNMAEFESNLTYLRDGRLTLEDFGAKGDAVILDEASIALDGSTITSAQ